MEKISNLLIDGIKDRACKFNIPLVINKVNNLFFIMFTESSSITSYSEFKKRDTNRYNKFVGALIEEGVIVSPIGLWFMSSEHDEKDVIKTLVAVEKVLKYL